jgi:hypothetical protein
MKERTQGYCESWKRVTVAGRTSLHARVAWCRKLIAARMRKSPECNNGIRRRDVKQPRFEGVRKCNDISWKTFRLEIVKRANEMSSGLTESKEMDLVERWAPLKRKKELQVEREPSY